MGDPHLIAAMSDEDLLTIWNKVEDADNLTLMELAVRQEVERRSLEKSDFD